MKTTLIIDVMSGDPPKPHARMQFATKLGTIPEIGKPLKTEALPESRMPIQVHLDIAGGEQTITLLEAHEESDEAAANLVKGLERIGWTRAVE